MKKELSARWVMVCGLPIALLLGLLSSPALSSSFGKAEYTTIMIIEYADHIEVVSDISKLDSGEYYFLISNRAQKDADFVLAADRKVIRSLNIEKGTTGRFKIELDAGTYSFYSKKIPTPKYPLHIEKSESTGNQ